MRTRALRPVLSYPSSSLGTPLSAKLRFGGVEKTMRALPDAGVGKQSFQDKRMTKLELGHEKKTPHGQSRK